jgi:hypothetical protein
LPSLENKTMEEEQDNLLVFTPGQNSLVIEFLKELEIF